MLLDLIADRRGGVVLHIGLRLLAIVDAVVIQLAALWWIAQQPKQGGIFGTTAAVILIIWAVRRASRAVFEFDTYNWLALKIARWLLVLWGVGLTVQLWRHISGQ